jgi:hypothetical protein
MALGPYERTLIFDELGFHEATAPEASFRAGRTRLRHAAGRHRYTRAFPGKVESGFPPGNATVQESISRKSGVWFFSR